MRWIVIAVLFCVGCVHTQNTEVTIRTLTCEIKITSFSKTSKEKDENEPNCKELRSDFCLGKVVSRQ